MAAENKCRCPTRIKQPTTGTSAAFRAPTCGAKTLKDLLNSAAFIFAERPLQPDEKAAKLLSDDARAILGELLADLESLSEWTLETVDAAVRAFVETRELKLGKVGPPLRAALTGTTNAPGIFDVLAALGQEESCARIRDQAR